MLPWKFSSIGPTVTQFRHSAPIFRSRVEFVEQCLSFFQVGSVEALGEPVVDLAEHRSSLIASIGVAQQSRETLGCELTVFARVTCDTPRCSSGYPPCSRFPRSSRSAPVAVADMSYSVRSVPVWTANATKVQLPHQVEADGVPASLLGPESSLGGIAPRSAYRHVSHGSPTMAQ